MYLPRLSAGRARSIVGPWGRRRPDGGGPGETRAEVERGGHAVEQGLPLLSRLPPAPDSSSGMAPRRRSTAASKLPARVRSRASAMGARSLKGRCAAQLTGRGLVGHGLHGGLEGGFADRVPTDSIAGAFAGCLDGLSIEELASARSSYTKTPCGVDAHPFAASRARVSPGVVNSSRRAKGSDSSDSNLASTAAIKGDRSGMSLRTARATYGRGDDTT